MFHVERFLNFNLIFMKISGQLIDIHKREIYPAEVRFDDNIINGIERIESAVNRFILPGLIDSHVHIESSMITPCAFAAAAVRHGTTGVVSDPHEIANVMGMEGIKFMIDNAKKAPVRFWFGAPSCVPATSFETSGGRIDEKEIRQLLEMQEIKYMAEMMNFPGVINNDPEVHKKLNVAKSIKKPIDGHAPGLFGAELKKYISSGISTDHECSTLVEAKEKIALGMKILIREGSAARNLNSLKYLFRADPEMIMLCSDDIHPEMLAKRHINKLVAQLISEGYNLFDVIRSCTVNPVLHYNLEAGLLQPGQSADFIIVNDYLKMDVRETWIKGEKVFEMGSVLFDFDKTEELNRFNCSEITYDELKVLRSTENMRVIEACDGELTTKELIWKTGTNKFVETDIEKDILKIIVKDRYLDSPPAIGFIKGFGLKHGAFAGSVAHDSHNIICIGTNDDDIVNCVNEIVRLRGGLSFSVGNKTDSLQLNIAGIMSNSSCEQVASKYESLSNIVKSNGCTLKAPYMTLSFMALLVIPELKMSDRGLFDVKQFCFTPLFVD
jgi:adenine deaminase